MGYATNLCSKKDLLGIVARTSFSLAWRRLRSLSQFQIVRFRQAVHASLRRRLRIKIFVKFLSIVISIARIYMKFSNNVRTSSIKLGEPLWFSISLKANVTRNTFSRKFSRQIYSSKFQPVIPNSCQAFQRFKGFVNRVILSGRQGLAIIEQRPRASVSLSGTLIRKHAMPADQTSRRAARKGCRMQSGSSFRFDNGRRRPVRRLHSRYARDRSIVYLRFTIMTTRIQRASFRDAFDRPPTVNGYVSRPPAVDTADRGFRVEPDIQLLSATVFPPSRPILFSSS